MTEDDFIVNDSEEGYETASSSGSDSASDSGAAADHMRLEEDWTTWGQGTTVDDKLRDIVKSTGIF